MISNIRGPIYTIIGATENCTGARPNGAAKSASGNGGNLREKLMPKQNLSDEQRQKRLEYFRLWRAMRFAAGLCVNCKNPHEPNRRRCTTCREITSDYSAGRRDIRKVKGLCTICGKVPPVKGLLICQPCRIKNSEFHQQNYQSRKGKAVQLEEK